MREVGRAVPPLPSVGGGVVVAGAFESVQFACTSATITTSPLALQSPPHVLYFDDVFCVIAYVAGATLNVMVVPEAVASVLDEPFFFMDSVTFVGCAPVTSTTVIFTLPFAMAACTFCTSTARDRDKNANKNDTNAMRAPAICIVYTDSPMLAGFPPRAFRILS